MSYQGSSSSDIIIKTTRPQTGDYYKNPACASVMKKQIYISDMQKIVTPVYETDSGSDTDVERPVDRKWTPFIGSYEGGGDTGFKSRYIPVLDSGSYTSTGSGFEVVSRTTCSIHHPVTKIDETFDGGGDDSGSEIGDLKKKKHKFKISRLFKRSPKKVAVQVKPVHTIESRTEDVRLLKQHAPDETIVRTKAGASDSVTEAYPYDITVTTGDNENAGTTANVFIKLIGENNLTSRKLLLPIGKFDRGKSHKFHKVLPLLLSPLTRVDISHDNSGESPDWYCEHIIVYSHKTGFKQVFPCQQWLQKNDDQNTLQRQLFENTELTAFKTVLSYAVTIVTGKQTNDGTDAQVYISFHGKREADVEKIKIPKECSPKSSHKVLIQLEFAIEYIEVGHDNTGTHPDWFCDHVTANCQNTGFEQMFRCKHWLSKSIGDGLVKRRLYASNDLNNKGLQQLCDQYGRSSTEVQEACNNITIQILACSKSFKQIWPAYQPSNPGNIVFVVLVESGLSEHFCLPKQLTSFIIKYRATYRVNREDNEIITIENNVFSAEEKDDEDRLVDVLNKSSKKFMQSHSNLNMISASPVKSRYFTNGPGKHKVERKPCIVFYVSLKGYIPIQENPLPHKIGNYITDVREDEFIFFQGEEEYLERLKIGCSVGEKIGGSTFGGTGGTLGAFVDLPNQKVGCITSAHTLFSKENLIDIRNKNVKIDNNDSVLPSIYQPAPAITPIKDKLPFGYVSSAVYKQGGEWSTGVEVGIITITDQSRNPENGKFPKVVQGFTEVSEPDFSSGNIYTNLPDDIKQYSVYKYGATTGFTRGAFRLQGVAVRTSSMDLHPSCELHNQIEICSVGTEPFSKPGDSGALVFLAPNNDFKNLRAIGILTGGTTSCTMFFVTPIWEVLKALNLPLQLKDFGGPSPMITDERIRTEGYKLREMVTQTSLNKKIDNINSDIDRKIEQVNENVENEARKVDKRLGNVESKVDKIGSEMTDNFAKMFTLISANMNNNNN